MTVITDVTPVRSGCGPARLLDMVPGRSKQVFKTWFDAQSEAFRAGTETVALEGFPGFKTAACEALPAATAVMDPFHVVALAGDALDQTRQRVQRETTGHRGRRLDPLYRIRRSLHTGASFLTDRQSRTLTDILARDEHVEVDVTWAVYKKIVAAYRCPKRAAGKQLLQQVITCLDSGVPATLIEIKRLGRTLHHRATDVLAYCSNGPSEAINGRLEHLRGTALSFRNLTNNITHALYDTGGFRPHLHPQLR